MNISDIAPDEVVVEVESGDDGFGRFRFTAHWLDDNEWRGGSGVSGQCFHADLAAFTARAESNGKTVRVI